VPQISPIISGPGEAAPVAVAAGARAVAARSAARRRERRIAFVVVLLPVAGLVAALALLWGRGIGPAELGLLVGMYTLTMLGVGVGLHRYFAHGSFRTSRALRALLAILGSMAAQGPPFYWVAVHRRHHSHSDRPGDPHSPNLGHGEGVLGLLRGLWHAHIGWMFSHDNADWPRYTADLVRDPDLLVINRLYFAWVLLGLAIPAALGGMLAGSWAGAFHGFLWGGLVRVFFVHHASWSLGSISHVFGSSPFPTRDGSTNNAWTALPTFGESWHNNHHAFPSSAFHGLAWWQVDVNGLVIRALAALGLVWDVKAPSPYAILKAQRSGH
jgi:stearoyl-CoA desaturase (delta-9 desaturase)